jgi:hypothetical protein
VLSRSFGKKKEGRFGMKLKPEILTHPNIPKPLHGIAPRTIKGKKWWDEERQKAYKSTDYHCVACGVPKHEAKKHKWLEAHEYWNIDYNKGICEVVSLEPLCHYCHNFIHSGRLSMIIGEEKSYEEVLDILKHGFKVLSENKLRCFPHTLEFAESIGADTFGVKAYKIKENPDIKWTDWKLIFDGKEYRSNFKSIDGWSGYYENL